MLMRFNDWESEIKDYCDANGLDFEKARKSPRCFGKNDIFLQHCDITEGTIGLRDETPAPITLIIAKNGNGIVFKQTEYTKQYLSI